MIEPNSQGGTKQLVRCTSGAGSVALRAQYARLDIEFSQVDSRTVQRYGLDLNTSVYVSPRLLALRTMLPVGSRVDVK